MPSINTASQEVTSFPNLFVSPFGNDGIIPLYSSIPISNNTSGDCLPCVLCGNSNVRKQVIQQEANAYQQVIPNGVDVAVGT